MLSDKKSKLIYLDFLIIFITMSFLVLGENTRRSVQLYTLTMSVIVVATQLSILYVAKPVNRKKRFLYTGMQLIFFLHVILFYSVALSKTGVGIDFGTWSAMLRAHLVITMAVKERTALAKLIRRGGITHDC